MARRKKKNSGEVASAPMDRGPRRINISIEEAENGFSIRCSGEGKNGEYHSKNYVAPNEKSAIRIAGQGLSGGLGRGGKSKKGDKKKTAKMSIGKRDY